VQQKQLQNVAVHSGESLLGLINDVLDYSKIVSGAIYFNESVFSLRRCVNQCLELLGPVAHGQGVEVSVIYDRDTPVRIKSDEDRLAQIITNLVTSVIRHSDGSEVIVKFGLRKQGDDVGLLRLDVIDNGKSFSDTGKQSVFEAFSKSIHSTNSLQQGGTGLGLAIVKGLVESRGGEVGFETYEKAGAHFWFTLGVGVSTQQAQIDYSVKPLVGKHALIYDNHIGMVEALVAELEELSIRGVPITGADNAINELHQGLIEEREYSLVIINCPIREHISFEMVERIQAEPKFKDIKIVMLASLAQRTRYQLEADKFENLEWLTKPVTRVGLSNSFAKFYDTQNEDQPTLASHSQSVLHGSGDETQTILLVEDNKVNQMVARGMLNKLGYTVSMANNGKEALSILEDKHFDLILMDCLMPEMDGYQATKEIRNRELNIDQHIPIIAMTASVIEGEQTRCLSAGMDDYLAKPVNIDDLGAKLRLWLEEKKLDQTSEGVVHTGKQVKDNSEQQRRLA
ncbi:MAG: response regulator, partial [Pseudomonadales bacterium]|nr:response regulator [Pseudomonadales bacterium]